MNNKKNIQREKMMINNTVTAPIIWLTEIHNYKLSLHVYIAHIVIAMYVLVL